ncbi:MAG: Threonyl-tRNA synthetase [uncultured bacterium (gcode 4)]|uniref:Threonine--tRNA ligase n=1 Tax=uncultured bacterium (gcode 4) TaxID=1234023 RepID=K2G4B6_9BACT|nr:MAG: Threonyl-tRNA synthetase [uncultured bacterium (gcode 4)]
MNQISTIRHSLSHILAQSVKSLYPEAKLAIGPDIDNWFYYDFDFGEAEFKEENLKEIEKKMKNIIKQNQKFEWYKLPVDEAIQKLKALWEIYKVEMAEDLKNAWETEIGFYKNITQQWQETFEDMCRGPHVEKSLDINENAFKLDKIAWAYWKGDSDRKMLTRIYGFSFETREKLDEYLKLMEEAKKRDHRLLWKKLKLFSFSDKVGLGLPLWLPNGAMLWKQVEDFWKEEHEKNGYDFVRTPHIWNKTLWETSGHFWFYADSMYPPMEVGQSLEDAVAWVKAKESETFLLKPMNCPFHVELYSDEPKSYREFPLRWCETWTVYRFEKKWQLNWLTRVRWFTQDDAHIMCRRDQVEDELKKVINFILYMYDSFWFDKNTVKVYLSLRDPNNKKKYAGNDEWWDLTQTVLEKVAQEMNLDYTREEWEAAFYGPKLDFKLKDVLGREWQCSTLQFDFNLPERFDMKFTNSSWEEERPFMLHRALFWSFERFIWLLIEHYAWAFPAWLAPVQVKIVPVSDVFNPYADEVYEKLRESWIRVKVDDSTDSLNKKVRNAEMEKIPYILIVWEKEQNEKSVSIRNYKTKEQSESTLEAFSETITVEIKNKR